MKQGRYERFINLMVCDFFNFSFCFMEVLAFSRESAGRFYTNLGSLFDCFRQNLVLVSGLDAALGVSDCSRASHADRPDVGSGIFVPRFIANVSRGWY